MSYSSRFWLYAPLALFLALAFWAMSHWWLAAKALDQRLIALNGHQAIPGVRVAWSKQTISGFPFRLDVVFDDFSVRAEAPRGPLTWHSDHFALHSLTYGRTQDVFEAAVLDRAHLALFKKHQRREQARVGLVALEEVNPDGQADGDCAGEKPWGEETHTKESSWQRMAPPHSVRLSS